MASSEKLGLAPPPPHQIQTLNPHPQQHHLVFPQSFSPHLPQHHHHRPIAPAGDPVPKSATRELTASFLDHRHYFQQPPQAADFDRQWRGNTRSSDDDDDDDDDDEGEENNLENFAKISDSSNPNERYSTGNSSSSNNNQKPKHVSGLGLEEGSVGQSGNENNSDNKSVGEVRRGGETYYTQYLNRAEGPSSLSGQKDCAVVVAESGCGFSGRKEGSYASDSGESLRSILSDPLTGTIMDDAMILPCGHSFGSGGIQQVLRMKACSTCSRPVSEDSIAPNLSLRLAVQAFKREEETQFNYTSKRRRERYDRDKGTYPDFMFTYHPREKGVQFPFAVTDRVIIKGNKRTPQRFVGREAIVTTQCLNGWYVVKTLDNAESVKLQYRSLAKVTENNNPSSKLSPIKMTPNWL